MRVETLRIPNGASAGRVLTSDGSGNGTWQSPAGGAGSVITGAGAPTAGVGLDGSLYLDTTTLRLWGPKAAGAWPGTPIGRLMPTDPTWGQTQSG